MVNMQKPDDLQRGVAWSKQDALCEKQYKGAGFASLLFKLLLGLIITDVL